jgi:hypothetical protein
MREIQETVEIPAEPAKTKTVTRYGCDAEGCPFTSTNIEVITKHYGQVHTVKERRQISGVEWLLFASIADIDSWCLAHAHSRVGYSHIDYVKTEYNETGSNSRRDRQLSCPKWFEVSKGNEECPRGCCTKSFLKLTAIDLLVSKKRATIREAVSDLRAISEMFGNDKIR